MRSDTRPWWCSYACRLMRRSARRSQHRAPRNIYRALREAAQQGGWAPVKIVSMAAGHEQRHAHDRPAPATSGRALPCLAPQPDNNLHLCLLRAAPNAKRCLGVNGHLCVPLCALVIAMLGTAHRLQIATTYRLSRLTNRRRLRPRKRLCNKPRIEADPQVQRRQHDWQCPKTAAKPMCELAPPGRSANGQRGPAHGCAHHVHARPWQANAQRC